MCNNLLKLSKSANCTDDLESLLLRAKNVNESSTSTFQECPGVSCFLEDNWKIDKKTGCHMKNNIQQDWKVHWHVIGIKFSL